ncbi:MAG: ABC transporter permease subunit [Verrucomicrobia bacterium]|nr:ABC transporter permease subunit [Verrucomicrobiota bacterium]
MSKPVAAFVYLFTITFFGAFFLWPIWQVVQGGFFDSEGFTMSYFVEVFRNPIYLEGLRNSFGIAVFSTLGAMLIAVPLAFIADRYEFPGRKLLMGLILLPIMLPPFVGAIGVRQILGQYGALNAFLQKFGILSPEQTIDWLGQGQFWGVVIVTALSLYPILYLNAVASLANIDPAMEEAAENLGCRGWKRFFKITLPLMRPGLFAGATIVFIWAFTELGVPLIFDYNRLTSVQIFFGIKDIGGNPFPFALVCVMLLFSILFYAIGKGLFGRNTFAMMAKASHAGGAKNQACSDRLSAC